MMTWTQQRKAALERMWSDWDTTAPFGGRDNIRSRILVALSYLDERLQRRVTK